MTQEQIKKLESEQAELVEKLNKLKDFIDKNTSGRGSLVLPAEGAELDGLQVKLLIDQYNAMASYANTLSARIGYETTLYKLNNPSKIILPS